MQIVILGKNLALTQALKSYVREKVNRSLLYLDHRIQQVRISLVYEKTTQIAKLCLNMGKKTLAIEENSSDMYHAIDGAVSQLNKQISKQCKKRRTMRRSERT